jgi:hypothetical protein
MQNLSICYTPNSGGHNNANNASFRPAGDNTRGSPRFPWPGAFLPLLSRGLQFCQQSDLVRTDRFHNLPRQEAGRVNTNAAAAIQREPKPPLVEIKKQGARVYTVLHGMFLISVLLRAFCRTLRLKEPETNCDGLLKIGGALLAIGLGTRVLGLFLLSLLMVVGWLGSLLHLAWTVLYLLLLAQICRAGDDCSRCFASTARPQPRGR